MVDGGRWRRIAAVAVLIVVAAVAFLFRDRIAADFWPLDRSTIGPNLLASLIQAAIVFLAVVLFYPPLRRHLARVFHHFVDAKLDRVHHRLDSLAGHHERLREHNEWVARHVAEAFESQTGRRADPHPHFGRFEKGAE